MTRPLTLLAGLFACVLTLSPFPTYAADPELETTDQKLDALKKELAGIKLLLGDVKKDVGDLRAELSLRAAKDKGDYNDVLERIRQLEKMTGDALTRLDRVDNKPAPAAVQPRTAFFGPVAPGRIHLVNNYDGPVSITINGKPYQVPARQTQMLEDQPAGLFTYYVNADPFGTIQPPVSRELLSNKVFTIEVFTRR